MTLANPPRTAAQRATLVGWGLALIAQFGYSWATPIVKAAIGLGLLPTMILSIRLVITTALLGGMLLLTGARHFHMDRRGLLMCGLIGVINTVGMIAYFTSLQYISASVAVMIYALSPLVLLLLMAFAGERLTRLNLGRVAFGLAGVYLLIGPGGDVSLPGAALAFFAVISVPVQLMLMQLHLQRYDSRAVTFYLSVVMMLGILVAWAFQGAEWRDPGPTGWLLIVVLALVATALPRLTQAIAVNRIGAGETGLLAPLETFLSVIWSVTLLGERLTAWQSVGGGLILVSALLASTQWWPLHWLRRRPVIS